MFRSTAFIQSNGRRLREEQHEESVSQPERRESLRLRGTVAAAVPPDEGQDAGERAEGTSVHVDTSLHHPDFHCWGRICPHDKRRSLNGVKVRWGLL